MSKYETYLTIQTKLAKDQSIHSLPRLEALRHVCEQISQVMGIKRVSLWFFSPSKDEMREELTFVRDGVQTSGTKLIQSDYPNYFKHLKYERVLVCNDARSSEALEEFVENYLKPFDLWSLLDAPIFSDGELVGVLCLEDDKLRDWDEADQNFAVSSSDFMGRFIESEKRHAYENELRHRINYLENDLRRKLDDLNEAKLSLDLALESAQVGKWDWDVANERVFFNKTWFTKLGYDFNELPQSFETFRSTVHPEDINRVLAELNDHLDGKTLFYECRYRMLSKSGDIQWCLDRGCIIHRDSHGKPLRLTGVNVNVTPMLKWEESLIISEQQLKSMIRSLPTPVAMFDRDFKYIAFSSMWLEEWGSFAEVREGMGIRGAFRDEWIENMKRALGGSVLSSDEDLLEIISGEERWVRWVVQPWEIAVGTVGGVVLMAENITQRKEAEIRLAQTSKLSALGEMAGGIAHEINNPLSIIKGYIDLLRRHSNRNTLKEDLLRQYIEKMDLTVGRISRIVNGMRRFSRESSLDEKVEYSLNKVIEETLDICQERINNNGTAVEVFYLADDPLVLCRPVELSQVFLNLINNSFHAVSEFTQPWIKITLKDLGGYFRISIIDSGAGLPSSVKQKLFQPFFTTKDVGVGTGLGLSISRGIIEGHGGKLYYQDDAPNTTFVIELPKLSTEGS